MTLLLEAGHLSDVFLANHEDPVQLLFYGGHVLHVGGLIPLKEVQRPTLVLIKDPEQSFIKNIFLADRSYNSLLSIYCCCKYFYLGGVDIILLSDALRVLRVKHHVGITHFLRGKTVINTNTNKRNTNMNISNI